MGFDLNRALIIDATDLILGRMASIIAKELLAGRSVIVVNAERAVISGSRLSIISEHRRKLAEWRTHYNPDRVGPKIPRRPDGMVRRAIRGMLPKGCDRGRRALRRLRAFIGTPEFLKGRSSITIPEAHVSRLKGNYIRLGELAKEIGGCTS